MKGARQPLHSSHTHNSLRATLELRCRGSRPKEDLALLGSHCRESRDQLFHLFAATMRAAHLAAFAFRHVKSNSELLLAVATLEDVLGHNRSPGATS